MLTLNKLRTSLSAIWSSISVTATFLRGLVIFAFAWAFNFTSLLASLVLNHRLFNHRWCRLEMWHKRSGLNYSKGWVAELLTWHSRTLAFFTSGSFSFTSNSPTFWGKKGSLWSSQPSGSLQQFWGCEPTRRMISGINYSVNVQPGTWNCGIFSVLNHFITEIPIFSPQERQEVSVSFGQCKLMKHAFNVSHEGYTFLSKSAQNSQESVRLVRALQQVVV